MRKATTTYPNFFFFNITHHHPVLFDTFELIQSITRKPLTLNKIKPKCNNTYNMLQIRV